MADNKQLAKLEFISFCIEQYKIMTNRAGSEVERMFQQRGVLDFLLEHYETLHTQGGQAVMSDIEDYLKHHKA